jgi:exocyst complex component 1
MVIFVYSDLLYRVVASHNNKQFMHQPLIALLRSAKERCDEFIFQVKKAIQDYRVVKKEKIAILKPVLYFEEFVKESEIWWEPIKKEMYEKLCNIYQILVDEIIKCIEQIGSESLKTPPAVVRFQNYHRLHHIMKSINSLKSTTAYVKEQSVLWKKTYVKENFGRPLEKLSLFFEEVESKINNGKKPDDVSYDINLSANNLREIIREYPAREVKKGLEQLYNKLTVHLFERSSLLQVVWGDMSHEFLSQYSNFEKLIKKCYPDQNIKLEFSQEDVCKFFQDIGQS